MKIFSLHIKKESFFGQETLEFCQKAEGGMNVVSCKGATLTYCPDLRFEREEGVRLSSGALTFFNGLAYEYQGTYIASEPMELVHAELQKNVEAIAQLKGDFSGVLIQRDRISIFTSKTNSKPIFYYQDQRHYICSSDILDIVRILKTEGIKLPLNLTACYSLLSHDYIIGQETLLQGITRYQPAVLSYLTDNKLVDSQYFRFSNEADHSLSKADHIERLEETFTKAVHNEFQRDLDLGLKHVVTLSGGLDSRMVLAYGDSLGYKDITTVCFSQSQHREHLIAERVAKQYNSKLIFRPLDGGDYLKNIDTTVKINGGTVVYSGAAHTLDMMSHMEWPGYGILHTGQMGDGILGTFLSKPAQEKAHYTSSIRPSLLGGKIQAYVENELENYENNEMFKLYSKGCNAVFNGYRVIEQFTPFSSPFLDEDFVQAAFAIPAELRYQRKIYFEWIAAKLPSVAKMPTAGTNMRPLLKYHSFPMNLLPKFQRYKNLALYKLVPGHVVSMNPFKKWLAENDSLRTYIQSYYMTHLDILDEEKELKTDCEALFGHGFSGTFRVLTLLSAVTQIRA